MAKNLSGLDQYDSPDYEYSAQRSRIARKQALAQALQGQGMQPLETGRMAGGWAIPISPWEGAAKLAQTYVGGRAAAGAEKEQTELAKQSRADYQQMLAKVMAQMGTDPVGAIGTLSTHPRGGELLPLAMQQYQRQQLIKALGGGQGAPQAAPAGPQPGEGQGYGVVAPQAPAQPAQPSLGGPAGGVPLEAWLAADPTGKAYLSAMAQGNQALGGVQYDQEGRAFVTNKQGGMQYLPGIMARDKLNFQDVGPAIQGVNEYTGQPSGAPIQKGLTPMQSIQAPLEQEGAAIKRGQYEFETGNRLPQPVQNQAPPVPPMGAPPPTPQAQPVPSQPPRIQKPIPDIPPPIVRGAPSMAQAGPQGMPIGDGMTPKQRTELAAKRAEEKPKALLNLNAANTKADSALRKVDEVTSKLSAWTAGAPGALLSSIPGTPQLELRKNIETLQNILSIKELQDMREASKTGGAVGQVTEAEWEKLSNTVASLSQSQSKEQLATNLGQIKAHFEKWRAAMTRAYENTYGPAPAQAGSAPRGAQEIEMRFRAGKIDQKQLEKELFEWYLQHPND